MALFPGALPAAGTAVPNDTLIAAGHTALHNTSYDEARALGTKLGTGASTPAANTVLTGTGAGTSAWAALNVSNSVTGILPVANGGTGASGSTGSGNVVLATAPSISNPTLTGVQAANVTSLLGVVYPVGCVYTETTGTNPATTFGFGTWTAFGGGRVLIGNGTSDATYNAGATGGESNHQLTVAEMPAHTHAVQDTGGFNVAANQLTSPAAGGTGMFVRNGSQGNVSALTTGGDGTHNNLQPYIVVYIWKRTA